MSTSAGNIVDLESCAREPIHIPGAIQPHGVLLAVREPDLAIVQASTNCATLFGRAPAALLGRSLRELLGSEAAGRLDAALAAGDPARISPLRVQLATGEGDALFHKHDGLLIAEFEPRLPGEELHAQHHRELQRAMTAMQDAPNAFAFYDVAAKAVAALTGFERVMIYQFDADWHGEVVGESLLAPVDSYMGLHFPASDIPEQARALYARTWLRIIPTSTYTPAALEPALNPLTQRPLDLSFAALRSVSPIHLEYLRNMNVGASMSISLIVGGRLWGLIACHHRTSRALPFSVRAACELFGQITSAQIAARERTQRLTERAEVMRIQTRYFDAISSEQTVGDALLRYAPELLQFLSAGGAAICLGPQRQLVGQTPGADAVATLLDWLARRDAQEPIFSTDNLSRHLPEASAWTATASGLLAVKLSRVEPHWVLWFRPEVLSTVYWAGNPEKPVEPGLRIHPRKSFAAWQQTVSGRSLPWKSAEIEGAFELRQALNALVIRRTERLLKLNEELERKNTDLNSFAYIASHDLKEPLRGIFHFARFLREDHGEALGPEGLRKVETIAQMAAQTNELIGALARYSQLGRMELNVRKTDLARLVDDVLATLAPALQEARVEVRRPRALPSVACDPVLVREVFANLISNAIRYNDKPEKWVEISFREPADALARGPILTVRDNGIGLRERNFDAAFQMFRRLNKDQFGSGTGAGLAIVKSIVERHGGRVWVESTLGEGATFLFTLE